MRIQDYSNMKKVLLGAGMVSACFMEPTIVNNMLNVQEYSNYIAKVEELVVMPVVGMCFPLVPYFLTVCGSSVLERKTDDVKEIKTNYDKVLTNYVNLCKEFNFENPVEIYALYTYMYRKGFLSNNKNFIYDTNMKDFATVYGADVLYGHGVCRNIGAMLSDIYNKMNLESGILIVCCKDLTERKKMSLVDIQASKSGIKSAEIIGKITNANNKGNHIITEVNYDGKTYILDPTNDVMLEKKFMNIKVLNGKIKAMNISYLDTLRLKLFKNSSCTGSIMHRFNKPTISQEEYLDIYSKTNKVIESSEERLLRFYEDNKEYYESISNISSSNKIMLKRKFL